MEPKECDKDLEYQKQMILEEEFLSTPHNRKQRRHSIFFKGAEYKFKTKYINTEVRYGY